MMAWHAFHSLLILTSHVSKVGIIFWLPARDSYISGFCFASTEHEYGFAIFLIFPGMQQEGTFLWVAYWALGSMCSYRRHFGLPCLSKILGSQWNMSRVKLIEKFVAHWIFAERAHQLENSQRWHKLDLVCATMEKTQYIRFKWEGHQSTEEKSKYS